MKTYKTLSILVAAIILIALIGVIPASAQESRPESWSDDTHGDTADADYEAVFPQDEVNTINISISPENWQAVMDDMTEKYGEFGSSPRDNGGGGEQPPVDRQPPPEGQQAPGGFGDEPGGRFISDTNPVWITSDISFDGLTWENVGFRLKGNSSLNSAWSGGDYKLPFKLDFDEFEDDYPEIDDQRFYGFKQLTFSSNWSDDSYLREKVTADIFRDMGIPSAQTAFYAVYVDYGEGPVYFGLYTAVEVIDDTVIETQFDDDSGNVYKPSGDGASFAEGAFSEVVFDKETNKDEADYSDILAVFDALHADTRLTDSAVWRAGLESVFDVDIFLRWLAVNTVVQNWDTYGSMPHNYYLYTDPTTGLITWIPWDNNMSLSDGMVGNRGANPPMGEVDQRQQPRPPGDAGMGRPESTRGVATLDQANVGDDWPLVRYLMDDPIYHELYVTYVDETITTVFEPGRMTAIYQELYDLVTPYVVAEQDGNGQSDNFSAALTQLIEHVNERYIAAQEYVIGQMQ